MTIPIPLVLDLWALGHASADIARRFGLPNHRYVERIVKQARLIKDSRAVVHVSIRHKPTGNARKVKALLIRRPDIEVVPLIGTGECKRGHVMTSDNILASKTRNRCRTCHRAREIIYYRKGKK